MPERAQVTSIEAIEAFRSRLIVYRDRAGRVLDEVSEEVLRMRVWLQSDRIPHWEGQIRRRQKDLEMRQQELFSAQISGMRDASFTQQQAVHRARRALQEAEDKLRLVKTWNRQYDQRVEPTAKQVEKLRHNLTHDLAQGVAHLDQVIRTLTEYSEISPSGSAAKPADASSAAPDGNPPEAGMNVKPELEDAST
jgi:chromosome segregation ATPase